MHFIKTSHPLIMNIKRTPKQRPDDQPPKKLTKLEIVADEPEHDKYDFHTKVECRTCNIDIGTDTGNVSSSSVLPVIPHTTSLSLHSSDFTSSFDRVDSSYQPLSPRFCLPRHWLDNLIFKPFPSTSSPANMSSQFNKILIPPPLPKYPSVSLNAPNAIYKQTYGSVLHAAMSPAVANNSAAKVFLEMATPWNIIPRRNTPWQ